MCYSDHDHCVHHIAFKVLDRKVRRGWRRSILVAVEARERDTITLQLSMD